MPVLERYTRHDIGQVAERGHSLLANVRGGSPPIRSIQAWLKVVDGLARAVAPSAQMVVEEGLAMFSSLRSTGTTTHDKLAAGLTRIVEGLETVLRTHTFAPTPIDDADYACFLGAAVRLLERQRPRDALHIDTVSQYARLTGDTPSRALSRAIDERLATVVDKRRFNIDEEGVAKAITEIERGTRRRPAGTSVAADGVINIHAESVHMNAKNSTTINGPNHGVVATGDGAQAHQTVPSAPLTPEHFREVVMEAQLALVSDGAHLSDEQYEWFTGLLLKFRKLELVVGDLEAQQAQLKAFVDTEEGRRFALELRAHSEGTERALKVLEVLSLHGTTAVVGKVLGL